MKIFYILFALLFSVTSYSQSNNQSNRSFNPKIGVNALFLSQTSSQDKSEDGIKLQEVELKISSDIDTYFTGQVLLAIEEENDEYIIEPEEVYIESISLPYATLKVGKFKIPINKHNQLHSHSFPFINAPPAERNYSRRRRL